MDYLGTSFSSCYYLGTYLRYSIVGITLYRSRGAKLPNMTNHSFKSSLVLSSQCTAQEIVK